MSTSGGGGSVSAEGGGGGRGMDGVRALALAPWPAEGVSGSEYVDWGGVGGRPRGGSSWASLRG